MASVVELSAKFALLIEALYLLNLRRDGQYLLDTTKVPPRPLD